MNVEIYAIDLPLSRALFGHFRQLIQQEVLATMTELTSPVYR